MSPYTPIEEVGEFGLIDRVRAVLGEPEDGRVAAGIGDDAAVYRVGEGRVHLVTTDALIEGVHFDRTFARMEHLGDKAISVNASDVAAMNGLPLYATVALGAPHNVSVEMVEALYRGMAEAAERYGLTILGGDTTAAPRLMLSVTVIGEAAEEAVVYRRGARPGDLVCVTGDVGSAYAGLKVLLDEKQAFARIGEEYQPNLEPYDYVIRRQLAPVARVDAVRDWAARGVRPHALIDVSDGVASELNHLCRQSGCGALVHGAALPIDLQARAVADRFEDDVDTYALFGGEDYELLFALPEALAEALEPESFSVIGRFTPPEEGVRLRTPEGRIVPLQPAGYRHF